MAKLEITERDKVMLENLPKLIKSAKFELAGEVLIPAGHTLSYIGHLIKRMEDALAGKDEPKDVIESDKPSPEKNKKPKKSKPVKEKE